MIPAVLLKKSLRWLGARLTVRGGIFLVVSLAAVLFSGTVRGDERRKELVLYVAENGRDDWSGKLAEPNARRTDGPLVTLTRARDEVRRLRKVLPDSDVVVLLRGGTYRISQPLELNAEDSGRTGGAVTYAAYPGEMPVISGGRILPRFSKGKGGLWQTRATQFGENRHFEQLYVNGRRAIRARTPNRGYFYIDSVIDTGIDPATGRSGSLADRAFRGRPKDLAPLAAIPADRRNDIIVTAYHSWDISRHHISDLDTRGNILYLTGPYPPKFGHNVTRERYLLENYREALDSPGEWFLDRNGTLSYLPRVGDSLTSTEAIAPVTDTLISVTGRKDGPPAANITFRGITFSHVGYHLPPGGDRSAQAACKVAAAIMVDYARNVRFEGCDISHTGGYGIWFRNGCADCRLERCCLTDLGAGGVRLGVTGHAIPTTAETSGNSLINNNIIREGGRLWPDAVGILIGHSGDNRITHNDISQLHYTGISAGWRWGYGEVPSKGNIISFNRVHHLGWDVLADMGGIYTLGESPGTVISNNVIHDIDGDGAAGMHGLYNDNSSSFILLENNLVYNVRDGGYHLGSGRDNTLRNNIFIASQRNNHRIGQLHFDMYYPEEEQVAATIEKNIFYGSGGWLISGPEFGGRLVFQNNIYWDPSGREIDFAGRSFAAWRGSGRDAGSIIADPGFVDPDRGNFRIIGDSPVLRLGFVPFDPSQAGVYGDSAWMMRAREIPVPPWLGLPLPPPATIFDDFEDTQVGDVPQHIRVSAEGRRDLVAVTDETAASGRHSLKVTKVAGLKQSYNPHFWYSPDHRDGASTFSCDLRLDTGVELSLEWREYPGKPYYYVGPQMVFRAGKLLIAGTPLIDIPSGVWIHLDLSAGMGGNANGTWQLAVTLPGAKPIILSGLRFGTSETHIVTWIGFISSGSTKASYYLDNIRFSNSKAE